MTTEISHTYGQLGEPGKVKVFYFQGLSRGAQFNLSVGAPGSGGKGGLAPENEGVIAEFPNKGGAGGGRENTPIIDALTMYANSLSEDYLKPLSFSDPGDYTIEWPYDTDTATVIMINPGGGGGGGMGDTLPGEDGEDGLPGVTFVFPTYVPSQRPLVL